MKKRRSGGSPLCPCCGKAQLRIPTGKDAGWQSITCPRCSAEWISYLKYSADVTDALKKGEVFAADADRVTEDHIAKFGDFQHTDDYRTITVLGRNHELTRNQAVIVRALDEARLYGRTDVAGTELLKIIGSETSRLRDQFQHSPLWDKLIVKGKEKGFYRLNIVKPFPTAPDFK
jgi:hypothetical protein